MTTPIRKKLIEVSIPLEAINEASAREKSIRHGHPSTLHLWWARRPLAACRAVLFAQLVDDPSAWPERFPTEEAQDHERRRLHKVIEAMVPWEASNDEAILNAARWEIARSVAWGLGEEPPAKDDPEAILAFLQTKAPPVYDPFSGGGSIPLEAQRLGLRAHGSDLNPVAVLIGKALVEIPPKFAGLPPVNPEARGKLAKGGVWNGRGAQGLAEDVRHYGQWMRDEAEKRIGHLYPQADAIRLPRRSTKNRWRHIDPLVVERWTADLANGRPSDELIAEATHAGRKPANFLAGAEAEKLPVIAWLWARTVRSPDPAAKGAMVPLVSSFMLSTKEGKKAWVEIVLDPEAQDGWRFEVKTGKLTKGEEERLAKGTKTGRGSNFSCALTAAPINGDHVKSEGKAGRLGARLMAIVAEGDRSRIYLSPVKPHEKIADTARPAWEPEGNLPDDPRNFWTVQYGLSTFASLFTPRQLVALTSFSDLVGEAREKALDDARAAGLPAAPRLAEGGAGAEAYADAVATYLGLAVDRSVMGGNSLTRWNPVGQKAQHAFGRQALPMVWDYAETNLLGDATGSLESGYEMTVNAISFSNTTPGTISNNDARTTLFARNHFVISTDPPYYDNVGYADLSDFFYCWLRKSIGTVWPFFFRRLTTPKDAELVATPYRHGGKESAEKFFMSGMKKSISEMSAGSINNKPLCIYYAFKQTEESNDGFTSAGWASFLQSVVDAGLIIDGTWPLRTEMATRMVASATNALASSIVLVCRKRPADAAIVTRGEFIRALRRELPEAIDDIRKAGVGPVDMQQSVIGPGMGVFSRHAKVLEDDDSAMSVKTALALINRVWEEIDQELDSQFDQETQVALAWFASYGFDTRPSGDLITLANAKNIASDALFASGVFSNLKGKAALTPREDLPKEWTPARDATPTVWECAQHAARILNAADGGGEAASRLVAQMGPRSLQARALAYRLFDIATQKGWTQEALVYNELAREWPRLEDLAAQSAPVAAPADEQSQFSF